MRRISKLLVLLAMFASIAQAQQVANPFPGVLSTPVDENTVVRFFYLPPERDYSPYPLVLRVAANNEDRMRTAPLLTEGLTVYISLSEMKDLVAAMINSIRMPMQTRNKEVLDSFELLPETREMDVVIIYSNGAARGSIAPEDICSKLSLLNSTIKVPRAVWQFQLFRVKYACRVPDFNSSEH